MSPEDSPASGGPPFFIVCAPRSGSTLLRVMLDAHPDLVIPPESHFIPPMWGKRSRFGAGGHVDDVDAFLTQLERERRFARWELSLPDIAAQIPGPGLSFSDAIEAVYLAYARKEGGSRWADKTPKYIMSMPLLANLFPEARFVHMIRDGRDVALSVLDLEHLHKHFSTVAFYWARRVRFGKGVGSALGPSRYIEVRYEDLLRDPRGQIKRLCGFLDLSFLDSLAEHRPGGIEKIPLKERKMHSRIEMPLTADLREWRKQMTPDEVAEFEVVAGAELRASGYDVSPRRLGALPRVFLHGAGFAFRYLVRRLRFLTGLAGPRRRS